MKSVLLATVFCSGVLAGIPGSDNSRDRDTRRVGSQERIGQRDAKESLKKASEKLSASDKAAIPVLAKGDPSFTAELQTSAQKKGLVKAYSQLKGVNAAVAKDEIRKAKAVASR